MSPQDLTRMGSWIAFHRGHGDVQGQPDYLHCLKCDATFHFAAPPASPAPGAPTMTPEARKPETEDFEMASKAFNLFTLEERRAALKTFAGLRYPSIEARFFEAVYRVVTGRTK